MTDTQVAAEFPSPPLQFVDDEGREITVRAGRDDDLDALVKMYDDYALTDRAQGLPPVGEKRIREWLAVLAEGINVVAWHEDRAVGHATLLDCNDGTHELTIFVRGDYQHAGIGSRLIRALLGLGRERGVETVWLSVQRSNYVALNLYRSVGFETVDAGIEHEMRRDL